MAKDKPVAARLEGEEREALEAAAEEDGRKVSALVRRILVEWLKRNGRLPPDYRMKP